MTNMTIENGMVIDDVESVIYGLRELSGKMVSDLEVVRRFIIQEKNTIFYLDSNLNSFMQCQNKCIYAWLDTGFTNCYGEPIMISLLQGMGGFCGHVVGTVRMLADNVKRYYRLSYSTVSSKIETIKKKYESKAGERKVKHVLDERQYLLDSINSNDEYTELGVALGSLNLKLDDTEEVDDIPAKEEDAREINLSEVQEENTIGLLLEKMEDMQAYVDDLLRELDKVSVESKEKIEKLQQKNIEYKRVILQMRDFSGGTDCKEKKERINVEELDGHALLGGHDRILVVGGQELGINIMSGIAKSMGFEKKDLVFVDYDKAKEYMDRVRGDGKYSAVIFGSCPHKTTGNAGYSSAVEKFRQIEGMPLTIDARNKSGRLKVTKESFRSALSEVCASMRLNYAC